MTLAIKFNYEIGKNTLPSLDQSFTLKTLEKISQLTENWKLKKLLKPLYMPILKKYKFRIQNNQFRKEGENILKIASRALNEVDVFFWLEFGTLLGVIRDGKLIEHDTDIDVGVMLEDYSPKIEETLKKYGFVKTRKFTIDNGDYGIEESYELNNVSFDIFYFTKTEKQMYCHLFPFDQNKNHLVRELYTTAVDFKSIEWQGVRVNIPSDSHQRLTDTYGDYTVKIKDWYTPDAALNSRLIDKKVKIEI
jgi:phosphorylcholine metabolism protein LicD